MKTSCVKNGLAVGVILLFVGIALSPVITAVDNDTEDDAVDEPIYNSDEIRTSDEYEEIITLIRGMWVSLNWINRRGFFRGEVNMTNNNYGIFKLSGLRWSNGSIEYFEESAIFVYAYRFIGHYKDTTGFGTPYVQGITLGDIEWS